jgi:uncharacterized RDD family membrane protein YckC
MELTVSPADLTTCEECNLPVPVDRVIRHRNISVCIKCKSAFMQKLAEGARINFGELRYAGFWIRFAASLIDGFVQAPLGIALQFALGLDIDPTVNLGVYLATLAVLQLLSFIINILYEGLMVGRYGATVGKMACGIKIVMPDGNKPSYPRSFARFLAKLLSFFTAYIGYIIAAFDKEKRGLHDMICNTRVVYLPTPPSVSNRCPRCQRVELQPTESGTIQCSACMTSFQVEVFPALFREPEPERDAELIVVEGEAACFNHADKKATLPCHGCGRFLCAVCDCTLNGDHYCPACLDAGATKGKIPQLEARRPKRDSIALSLAVLPILVFYPTFITAPVAIFLSIRHWNSPRSIVPRSRIRFVIAIVFSLLQILGWIAIVYFIARFISATANL